MPRHHVVLRGRAVQAQQPLHPARRQLMRQQVQRCLLHPASQHAAAHQPGIDHRLRADGPGDHHGDHAVIAESVGQPQLQPHHVRVGRHRPHLILIVPPGGEVELLGDEAGDVLAPQHHVRVLLERRQGVGLVVLGTYRQDHAAAG